MTPSPSLPEPAPSTPGRAGLARAARLSVAPMMDWTEQ